MVCYACKGEGSVIFFDRGHMARGVLTGNKLHCHDRSCVARLRQNCVHAFTDVAIHYWTVDRTSKLHSVLNSIAIMSIMPESL